MTIQAVAFDFDGLMFNTEQIYEVVNDVLLERRGHLSDPGVVARMMGRPGRVALQIMMDAYGLDEDITELELESQQVYLELISDGVEVMPGLFRLLEQLESLEIPKSIATSSLQKLVLPLLERSDLLDRFEFILGAEDVIRHKPEPEIYEQSAARHGVDCAEMLVLEDSTVGCRAAVQSGAIVVAIPSKHVQEHHYAGARLIADRLDEPRVLQLFEQRKR